MKRLLSVLCMALIAGGLMFSSCTKKYEIVVKANNDAYGTVTGGGKFEENATATLTATPKDGYLFIQWNDGNTDNPRTITVTKSETYTAQFGEVPAAQTTVSFRGESWTPNYVEAVDFTSENYLTFYLYRTASGDQGQHLFGWLESMTGSYTYDDYSSYFQHRDPNDLWEDVDNVLGQGAGAAFYRWQAVRNTFAETINGVDLNALTIDAAWSQDFYDIEYYAANNEYGTQYPLNCTMKNTSWAWKPSKSGAAKNNNNLVAVK